MSQSAGAVMSQENVNADLRAGDDAFAARDYPVAVSFYTKYLQDAGAKQDRTAEREAYERLLDALVLGKMPALAEEQLAHYEQKFPGVNTLTTAAWRGDILFQQGKYREAAELYRKLLPSLTVQDPRRLRTLFAYGRVLEKLGRNAEAADVFRPLWKQGGRTSLGRSSFERLVLCLAAGGQPGKALELLLENPPEDSADREIYPLLAAYIALKQSGAAGASGAWKNLIRNLREGQNPLTYLVASSYGDAYMKIRDFRNALISYRTAFHAASDKTEMFDALNRMIAVISAVGDKNYAAKLAMEQLELFKGSLLSPAIKLRTAQLLRDSGNINGALSLYESVFANMNSSEQERKQAVFEYALLLGRLKRLPEAEKTVRTHFQQGREAEGEFLLGNILTRLKRNDLYVPLYEKIAERWPDRAAQAYLRAASACLEDHQPDRVLELLNKLRKLPGVSEKNADPGAVYLEAAALAQKKQYAAALRLYNEFLQKTARKDPRIPQALYHSGLIAFTETDMRLAAERFARLRKEYPKHPLVPQASSWLIQAYTAQNDVIAAERETWLLAEQYPDSEYAVDSLFRLAEHYAEEGAKDKAVAALNKLASDSRYPAIQAKACYELALQSYRNGDSAGAVRRLENLYEKFPGTPAAADGSYLHGDILRAAADFKSAIPFYRKVMEARPNSLLAAAACGSVGDCLLAIASPDPGNSKNELISAIQSYKKLVEMPACTAEFEAMALYRTGRCLELLGKWNAASEQYRKVLYKYPAAEAPRRPSETVWCVRAAEALIDMAGKHPLRSTLEHARFALHWLGDAKLIPLPEAAERFEKLKNNKFNP